MTNNECEYCGKLKSCHVREITRKGRKEVEVFYCHSIGELKRKKVNWFNFLNKKFKPKKSGGKLR